MKSFNKFVVLLIIFVFVLSFGMMLKVRAQEELESKLEIFLEVLSLVKNQYVKRDLDDTKLVYGAIRGLLDSLEDPYTRFVEPKAYKEMQVRLRGSYSGIGIYIGIKNKQLTVISPIQGTPAEGAGLKAKDKIVTIDEKSTKDMALEEAVSLIRGPEKTKVKLGIMRTGFKKPKDFVITRKKIVIKSTEFKMLDEDIAYVKLNTFEKKTAPQEMKKALSLARGKKANGLILDIRNNGGGLLNNAIDIGSMFIKSGIIVQTVDREGMREVKYSSGRVVWDKPIVVLINEASASASEILAGALRDNKIATLVGTRTFGKASVQSVRRLQDDSAVLITIAKYLTPNGDDISEKGISPDVVVAIPTEEANAEGKIEEKMPEEKEGLPESKKKEEKPEEKKEEEDIQLQKAIGVLRDIISKSYRGI